MQSDACAQIATADADKNKHITVTAIRDATDMRTCMLAGARVLIRTKLVFDHSISAAVVVRIFHVSLSLSLSLMLLWRQLRGCASWRRHQR